MNNDRLRTDLVKLAEDVQVVDMHDRVPANSHRVAVRRAVATSLASVALLAAIGAGAYAALPGHTNRPQPPATIVSTTPSPTPPTTSAPSGAPSEATDSQHSRLPGTTFYLTASGQSRTDLRKVIGNTDSLVLSLTDTCSFSSLSVSPGGTRIAWITDAGKLYVASADGSHQRVVTTGAYCLGGAQIRWWSENYFTGPIVAPHGNVIGVDAATATVEKTAVPVTQVGPVSANGMFISGKTPAGQRYVSAINGSGRHNINYTMPANVHEDGWSVRSVSGDGRYVAIGANPSDTSRNTGSFAILNVTTGNVVDVPGIGPISYAEFLANGDVFVSTAKKELLLDSSFLTIGGSPLWNQGKTNPGQWQLLTYVP